MSDRDYLITADCPGQLTSAVEVHDLVENEYKLGKFKSEAKQQNLVDEVKGMTLDAPEWLPFASEQYNISGNIKDYILVPVTIMPSDLPNRNGIGFPYTELTRFNLDTGSLAYSTWKGKPTHVEHNNQDPTQAKGVIFATAFRKMNGVKGDVWKVINLCGFDRNRDPILANKILTNQSNSFSMGAYARDYTCSICEASVTKGGCEHVQLHKPEFKIYNGHLAYLQAIDPLGFEVSQVNTPAYRSAITETLMTVD